MSGGSSRRYPPELRERAVPMVAEVRVQPHLATFPSAAASAVGQRMAPRDGRPLHRLERDHRGDDHGRRLNRPLGHDVSTKPTAQQPESSHRPIRLAQVDNALPRVSSPACWRTDVIR